MNLTKKILVLVLCCISLANCKNESRVESNELAKTDAEMKIIKQKQDLIIEEHLKNGA